jgi:hypothetical protein
MTTDDWGRCFDDTRFMPTSALEKCSNGCDAPVHPPSKVICKACIDKITRTLDELAAQMEARERSLREEGR